jgi:hypothetical protein
MPERSERFLEMGVRLIHANKVLVDEEGEGVVLVLEGGTSPE